jgi:hypothetical protein
MRASTGLEVDGTDLPTLVLNVTHPLVPDQIADFCKGKRAVLVVEEGAARLHRAGDPRPSCASATSTRNVSARTCCRWPASTPPR